MRDYLIKDRFLFNKISLKQILIFFEIINNSTLLKEEFVRKQFLKKSMHFEETISFLRNLKLISRNKENIQLDLNFKTLLLHIKDTKHPEEKIKKFIINVLFGKKSAIYWAVRKFLSNFQLKDREYLYNPVLSQRHKLSGLRNFLMELDVIALSIDSKSYILSKEYQSFVKKKKKRRISLKELLRRKKADEEIGKAAELEVLRYERKRLSQFQSLIEKIEYIALKDVSAGYDIVSFEKDSLSKRYIEVKAVSKIDYKFNWTRNEMEIAKFLRGRYYLYLLPCSSSKKFDVENLRIVNNPYVNIYKNKKMWERIQETVCFYSKSPMVAIN
jgi:hypothetical protein